MKMIEEGHGNLADFREISVHAARTLQLIFFRASQTEGRGCRGHFNCVYHAWAYTLVQPCLILRWQFAILWERLVGDAFGAGGTSDMPLLRQRECCASPNTGFLPYDTGRQCYPECPPSCSRRGRVTELWVMKYVCTLLSFLASRILSALSRTLALHHLCWWLGRGFWLGRARSYHVEEGCPLPNSFDLS